MKRELPGILLLYLHRLLLLLHPLILRVMILILRQHFLTLRILHNRLPNELSCFDYLRSVIDLLHQLMELDMLNRLYTAIDYLGCLLYTSDAADE